MIYGSILILLLIFLFTMKNNQTAAKVSVVALYLFSVLIGIISAVTTGQFRLRMLSPHIVSIAIAVIYFSRIARKEVRENKEA